MLHMIPLATVVLGHLWSDCRHLPMSLSCRFLVLFVVVVVVVRVSSLLLLLLLFYNSPGLARGFVCAISSIAVVARGFVERVCCLWWWFVVDFLASLLTWPFSTQYLYWTLHKRFKKGLCYDMCVGINNPTKVFPLCTAG
jgi:hypothetical protein